jgi:hypothetical protein
MDKKRPALNRRQFIQAALAGAAGLGLTRLGAGGAMAPGDPPPIYLPLVSNSSSRPASSAQVVHVHAPAVTDWYFDYDTYYGRTQTTGVSGVSQAVVDAMVDRGVTSLLGLPETAVGEAWRRLLPGYVAGERVAIKINLNNSFSCDTTTGAVDAIAQPLNAVIRGLIQRGVRQGDIVVYDAIRFFSDRLYQELAYKDIHIHDRGCLGEATTWDSTDENALVKFFPPQGSLPGVRLSDSLINAKYLINMPIMKGHPLAGVTLGFKNHFGSTNNPSGMHDTVSTTYAHLDHYNALVDLYSNPHIRYKTVLTVADGIYGSREYQNSPPEPWSTFGGASPCSLFFATDPVALDCVLYDLLKAERGYAQPALSGEYLRLAGNAGLGVFESGDPWKAPYGSGYTQFVYHRLEM